MKKIIITLIAAFALTAAPLHAQSSYVDAIVEYSKTSSESDSGQNNDFLKNVFVEVAKKLYPDMSDFKAQMLVEEYFSKYMAQDIASLQEPVMKKHISETNLRKCIQTMKFNRFFELKKIADEQMMDEFLVYIEELSEFYCGDVSNKPNHITLWDKQYLVYFNSYYENIMIVEKRGLELVVKTMSLGETDKSKSDEIRKDLFDNYKAIMYRNYHRLIPIDLMKEGDRIYKTTEFQELLNAISALEPNAENRFAQLSNYFIVFLRYNAK